MIVYPSMDVLGIYNEIIHDPLLPEDTGNLKKNITARIKKDKAGHDIIKIAISGAKNKVPYVGFLNEGTSAHNIPHAFGYGSIYPDKPNPYTGRIPFGVGGRFNNMFHPGSVKHKGFIQYVLVNDCINYFIKTYDVERVVMGNGNETIDL